MLRFKEKTKSLESSVEFDEYVPFTVEFESDSMFPPLYWRVGNGSTSLMEIGINKGSGAAHSITLTSIQSDSVRVVKREYVSSVSEKEGLPIFDLSAWKNENCPDEFASNFIDNFDLGLELTLGQDFISVSIVGGMEPYQFIKNNNVIFGIDIEGNLTNVDIINLSQEDIRTANSAI